MDLCNGGMIWSCCVDRDKVDFVDPELGAVKDAQCGEVHTTGGQARIVGGHDSKERILSSYHLTQKFKTDCSPIKPELYYAQILHFVDIQPEAIRFCNLRLVYYLRLPFSVLDFQNRG